MNTETLKATLETAAFLIVDVMELEIAWPQAELTQGLLRLTVKKAKAHNMNSARLSKSPRLQRVLAVLKGGEWLSTMDIIQLAKVCAVNSCISELRDNGFSIDCRRDGGKWLYRLG